MRLVTRYGVKNRWEGISIGILCHRRINIINHSALYIAKLVEMRMWYVFTIQKLPKFILDMLITLS